MQRLSFALLGLFLNIFAPALADAQQMMLSQGYWLRDRPIARGNGIRINSQDQLVTVKSQRNGWALVSVGGNKYWVIQTALKTPNRSAPAAAPAASAAPSASDLTTPAIGKSLVVTADGSPVRSDPGTMVPGSHILDTVKSGTIMQFKGAAKDSDGDTWYHVSYVDSSGKPEEGFIFENRVKPEVDDSLEAYNCPTGKCPKPGLPTVQPAKDIGQAADMSVKGYRLPPPDSKFPFNDNCSHFVNSNGLGDYGRAVISAADRVAPGCMYDSNIFHDVCPNYHSMSLPQKKTFLALLFAAMAQAESSCDPKNQGPGIHGMADGLFQMEYLQSVRKGVRNAKWCRTAAPTNTEDLGFQTECAVSIINDTVCKRNHIYDPECQDGSKKSAKCKQNKQIDDSPSYWHTLNGYGQIAILAKNVALSWGLCK